MYGCKLKKYKKIIKIIQGSSFVCYFNLESNNKLKSLKDSKQIYNYKMDCRFCMNCKQMKDINEFRTTTNRLNYVNCIECRNKRKPKRCIHNILTKYDCIDCPKVDYCKDHHIKKCICMKEKKSCAHCMIKKDCKKCADPKQITIKRMIQTAKQFELKNGRDTDSLTLIDQSFIESLMEASMNCFYCKKLTQFNQFGDTLCSIYRINRDIGYEKSNCVLSCRNCNLKKVGDRK